MIFAVVLLMARLLCYVRLQLSRACCCPSFWRPWLALVPKHTPAPLRESVLPHELSGEPSPQRALLWRDSDPCAQLPGVCRGCRCVGSMRRNGRARVRLPAQGALSRRRLRGCARTRSGSWRGVRRSKCAGFSRGILLRRICTRCRRDCPPCSQPRTAWRVAVCRAALVTLLLRTPRSSSRHASPRWQDFRHPAHASVAARRVPRRAGECAVLRVLIMR